MLVVQQRFGAHFYDPKSSVSIISITKQFGALQALVTKNTPTTPDKSLNLQKPSPRKDGDPEIIDYRGYTWKWCDKCFNGTWSCAHVTVDHVPGVGKKNKNRKPTPNADTNTIPKPTANIAETVIDASSADPPAPQANIAASASTLDFL